jgi:hypothetical protein
LTQESSSSATNSTSQTLHQYKRPALHEFIVVQPLKRVRKENGK